MHRLLIPLDIPWLHRPWPPQPLRAALLAGQVACDVRPRLTLHPHGLGARAPVLEQLEPLGRVLRRVPAQRADEHRPQRAAPHLLRARVALDGHKTRGADERLPHQQAAQADGHEDERPRDVPPPENLNVEQQVPRVRVDGQCGGGVLAPHDDARVGHVLREQVAWPAEARGAGPRGEPVARVAVDEHDVGDDFAGGGVDDEGAGVLG